MEDFDVFTNEIEFTKPFYSSLVNKFVNEIPVTPNGIYYQRSRKLQAEECLADNDDLACSFHLSEAVSATLRTMAVYREEQIKSNDDKLYKTTSFIKPVKHLIETNSNGKKHDPLMGSLSGFPLSDDAEISRMLDKHAIKDEEPLHKRYMKFSPENNVDNFLKILKEVPQEWTIVQLTAPYNPNENIKLVEEYRTEVKSLYITVMTNDYLDEEVGPFTVQVPANINKVGEKPLFTELYSLLDDNYKTIENAQFLNNKRLVQNYWAKREDIDLRMKSVINVMDKEWLGGWSCLLTGKLIDSTLRDKIRSLVDTTISDWGFIKLTKKQRILLYNLLESSESLASSQIKSCIRMILCENGNPDDFRQVIDTIDCVECTKEFAVLSDLCAKCLAKSFEAIHHFSLVDGLKAFSHAAKQVRENEEWSALKRAKRRPTILIVDEIIDTFPWESLPLLQAHPVTRMENLHFIYHLYKTHKGRFVDGHYVATAVEGRYVINPDKNLERMERRMSSFVRYWCPHWAGHVRAAPAPETFLEYLRDADIFLYCGHGDGLQLAQCSSGAGVESTRARAAAVLAGCGSVRLSARAPHAGAHHHYHIAGSPMVVGMLWEVTDLEVDKVVSTLVALFVTSPAPAPWQRVGKRDWSNGNIDTTVVDSKASAPVESEPDLLSAIAKARRSTNYVMIASSMVARGLPVRIVGEETKS